MTHRVYDGITPRIYFQEVWAWFYDGLAPSFNVQTPLFPLASFFLFSSTPLSQIKENETSPIAYKCSQTIKNSLSLKRNMLGGYSTFSLWSIYTNDLHINRIICCCYKNIVITIRVCLN
jgi:hypothetical protein